MSFSGAWGEPPNNTILFVKLQIVCYIAGMNEEFNRFVIHCGGNTKTSKILDCSADMVRKMKMGTRGVRDKYVQAMYRHKGFRLSFLKLFDLN